MGAFDIIVIVVMGVAFIAVVGTMIYKKLNHKGGGCNCGCEDCPHACKCHGSAKNGKSKK